MRALTFATAFVGLMLTYSPTHASSWLDDPGYRERILSDPQKCKRHVRNRANYLRHWGVTSEVTPLGYAPKVRWFLIYNAFGDISLRGCAGTSLAPDKQDAAIWYERAAIGHVAEAQYKLGRMLYEGDGIDQNTELGLQWLTSAALEANQEAKEYLSRLGHDIQPSPGRTTYQRMEEAFRDIARAERREMLSDAVTFVAAVATGVVLAKAGQDSSQRTSRPSPVQYVRPAPSFCTTTSSETVTGSGTFAVINATRRTFCN